MGGIDKNGGRIWCSVYSPRLGCPGEQFVTDPGKHPTPLGSLDSIA